MPIVFREVTLYQPRYPIVDAHSHGFEHEKHFVEMANRYVSPRETLPLFGDASVQAANDTMVRVGIYLRILKNLAAKPTSVPAANDFALRVDLQYPNLAPTGTIYLDYEHNEAEVECLAEAGIRGIALDSCWQGFHVNDRRLADVYRKISAYRMFVLMHAGVDSNAPPRDVETWPDQVLGAKDMLPDSIVIAAHLGANMNLKLAKNYRGVQGILLDLAWLMECCQGYGVYSVITWEEIAETIDVVGPGMVIYSSDYPWGDPGAQIRFWEEHLPDEA